VNEYPPADLGKRPTQDPQLNGTKNCNRIFPLLPVITIVEKEAA
jgi:hypothetical protein